MMKKIALVVAFFITNSVVFSQKNAPNKEKDTVKTEVINVISSYTPSISDAYKIKKNPSIRLGDNMKKKSLKYHIFSVPVASTFQPKTGKAKGVDTGKKETIYDNYIAAGFGTNSTPFGELFINPSLERDTKLGVYAKYISSEPAIENKVLNTNYSNLDFATFYRQDDRDFVWQIGADFSRNLYNWYGMVPVITLNQNQIDGIDEQQVYTNFGVNGDITIDNSYVNTIKGALSYFSDNFNSKELLLELAPKFRFPLDNFGKNYNDFFIDASLTYISGKFTQTYKANSEIEHGFFTVGLNPNYSFEANDFSVRLGAKVYLNSDLENKINQVFAYPDVKISYPVFGTLGALFIGAGGDLKSNTYKDFADENPYISPTLLITQTNEKYHFYGGVEGKLMSNVAYSVTTSYKEEQDAPLFVKNYSKYNATSGNDINGYEYGNSFSVIYDDIKTVGVEGVIAIELSKEFSLEGTVLVNSYTMSSQSHPWNLPTFNGGFSANYKAKNWFATLQSFYVDTRTDRLYSETNPSTLNGTLDLEAYFDVNANIGYHITDKFAVFAKFKNMFNSKYQTYQDFNVQGFQVLGGLSYQFDF